MISTTLYPKCFIETIIFECWNSATVNVFTAGFVSRVILKPLYTMLQARMTDMAIEDLTENTLYPRVRTNDQDACKMHCYFLKTTGIINKILMKNYLCNTSHTCNCNIFNQKNRLDVMTAEFYQFCLGANQSTHTCMIYLLQVLTIEDDSVFDVKVSGVVFTFSLILPSNYSDQIIFLSGKHLSSFWHMFYGNLFINNEY